MLFINIFMTLFAIQQHSWTALEWIRQTLMRSYNQLSVLYISYTQNLFSIKLITNRWYWVWCLQSWWSQAICSSMRRRYPWQPCEPPPPNRNLLGACKRRGQRTGVKWNLRLQQPQAPSAAVASKNRHTLTKWMQLTVRATPKTAVQALSNLVLNSTAMSKELWITNGKDTRCHPADQRCPQELPRVCGYKAGMHCQSNVQEPESGG